MTWFEDTNRHIIESKNSTHRLLYCQLCQKPISKSECQKLRRDKERNLYKVNQYHYDKLSKVARAERKEERKIKRLQELLDVAIQVFFIIINAFISSFKILCTFCHQLAIFFKMTN
jgi:CRISPR/Cas system-associated protein Cas10 (large subunit of type III CRISPR-Cas system)